MSAEIADTAVLLILRTMFSAHVFRLPRFLPGGLNRCTALKPVIPVGSGCLEGQNDSDFSRISNRSEPTLPITASEVSTGSVTAG